jgi:hypothetical protein
VGFMILKEETNVVEFVSYNGRYPNLCSGTLVLKINNKVVQFPDYCMRSGGGVWFDSGWDEHVDSGLWTVEVPDKYKQYEDEINAVVNRNVEQGCCGGCV